MKSPQHLFAIILVLLFSFTSTLVHAEVPTDPKMEVKGDNLMSGVSCTISNVISGTCINMNMGSATVNPSGGTPPYEYEWDSAETTQTATMLGGSSTGMNHTVTVTDALGCIGICNVDVFGEAGCCTPQADCKLLNLEISGCNANSLPLILENFEYAEAFNISEDCGFTPIITMTNELITFKCDKTNGGVLSERSYTLEINSVAVAMCCQVIDVVDDVAPVISSCPEAELRFECGDNTVNGSTMNTWVNNQLADLSTNSIDICDSSLDVSSNWASIASNFSTSSRNNYEIIFTVSDNCNNESTCATQIIIEDTSNPVINSCPPEVLVLDSGSIPEVGEFLDTWIQTQTDNLVLDSDDNCAAIVNASSDWVFNQQFDEASEVDGHIVNFVVSDENGNTATCATLLRTPLSYNCNLQSSDYSTTVCSNDNSSLATFNLSSSEFRNAIVPDTDLNGSPDSWMQLTYHINTVQAEMGIHAVSNLYTTESTTLYARVMNTLDGCYDVSTVTLNVVEKPIITQQPISSVICEVPSNVTLSVESSTTGVDYVWEGSLDGVTFYPVPDNTLNLLSLPINADYVPQYYRVTLTTSTAVNGITCSTTSRVVSVTHTGPEESLICNDIIQASVDGYCNLELVADQVLEAMTLSNNQYSVDLEDEEGNSVSNQEVGDYLGDTLTYKVVNKCTGLYCWGQVVLEDKIEPQISSCEDVIVPCEMDYDPESLLANPLYTQFAYPSYEDNCDGPTLIYTDAPGGQMCEQGYSGIVTRTWVVSDASGNSSSCTQTIYIDRVEVTEIVWPGDYMPTYTQSSPCTIFDLVNIDPAISGMPSGYTCPNLQFTFTDLEFEVCGASTKVLRTWYALDWCTGEYLEYGQNLEVYDDQPPVSYCGNTCFTIYTDPYTCSADFEIPAPIQWYNAASAPAADDNAYYYDCSDGSDFEIRVSYGVVADGVDYITPEDPCGEDFNDLQIVYTEVVPTADGRYLVSDLPVGLAWFRYEFVDACGNALSDATEWCTKDVIIKDGSKPEAICESFTKATLDASGHTVILAKSFDDGSFDRCSPSDSLTFEVKRLVGFCEGHNEDLEYGADVFFCCNDIGQDSIPVMFRVTDEAGLSDECVGYVCVTDPEPFTVSCDSGPFTFTCAEEISQFAYPAPSTNFLCSFPITTEISFDSTGISECGVGTATRTVTFKNSNTMAVVGSCIQNIIVGTDFTLNQSNITCPTDMTIPSCTVEYTPEILNSFPTILSSPHCSQLAISYIDSEPFGENANPACYTVLRTWTIIDWCVYNPEIPSVGRLECIQALNFNSIDGPMFTAGCDDVSTIDSNQDCEHYVVLQAMATDGDGCTPDSDLIYWYDLDQNNDGTIDVSNAAGNNASGTYPIGTHSITYYAEDGCGNVNSCSHTFTIENNSAPSAICRSEVVWSLGEDGATEVWASDFDLSSTASCGSSLSYSFTADGATQVLGFTCDDIANGMVDTIALQMYVFDGIGGVDYCDVLLILQDNHNVCGDFVAANGSGRIAGKVINESQIGVEDFEVRLKDMDEGDMSYVMTNADGEFAFSNPSLYEDYSLHPYNNENHKQGVSTLDIVLIQRHLLNIQSLDNPYKIIAADANRSFTLTAADLVDIRKLILEVFDEFPSSESWQFVSNETSFIDVNHPWDYQNEIEITNHLLDVNDAEFVAIKVGDVNSSVWSSVNSEEVEQRSDESLNLYANIQSLEEGEVSSIAIVNANDVMLYGLQYTLSFDPAKVAVESIASGIVDIKGEHVNYSQAGEGIITLSVDMPLGLSIAADEDLFEINMLAIEEVELAKAIDITSEATLAEAVIDGVTPANVSLSFIDASSDVSDLGSSLVVFQNKPNPFSANTRIDYSISEVSDNVELTVFDANGRVIYFESQVPEIGKNTFYLHKDNLSNGGVLYYKVEANNTSVIKRMVIIE